MRRHPAEVFGIPIEVNDASAKRVRKNHLCVFRGETCDKKSRLMDYPMGVCSVAYGEHVVALCPTRFLQDGMVFADIAQHHFGGTANLLVFAEVGLKGVGNFDFVLVQHKPFSSEIQDFVVIEFQTAQTTSTAQLVQALKDFLDGQDIRGRAYGFGLNLADIWKRTFTQILNKGIVMEHWGHSNRSRVF